ncbi:MAG TPA: porin family protein [Gemmatimonadales bacterium]
MARQSRWLAIPVIAVLAASPLQRAEAQSISFGVMAGASLSTFTGDAFSDVKNYAGFIAGGFVRVGALGFALQPGVYYTTKGVKSSDFSETTGEKTALDYVQIPIVLRLKLPMHLYVGAGPAIGFKLGCKVTDQASATQAAEDCKDIVDAPSAKSTEISGIVEAGFDFGKLSLGARADLGISNAFDAINAGDANAADVKTRTISAVLAIRF